MAAYEALARLVKQPLCVSERLMTRWGYRELLERRAASIIMPDLAWCGGLTEAKKIAAAAHTQYLPVAFHNCAGPITHFASWHLAMATPNLKILESGAPPLQRPLCTRRYLHRRARKRATRNSARTWPWSGH